jgi:DNA-binding PadR family transcriptional regulator
MGMTVTRTTRKRAGRKAKKSYTLSPESVEFLESMRKKRHALSISSVLEEILQEVRREQGRSTVERAVADYYSSLSREEAEDQAKWGEFALREFPNGDA